MDFAKIVLLVWTCCMLSISGAVKPGSDDPLPAVELDTLLGGTEGSGGGKPAGGGNVVALPEETFNQTTVRSRGGKFKPWKSKTPDLDKNGKPSQVSSEATPQQAVHAAVSGSDGGGRRLLAPTGALGIYSGLSAQDVATNAGGWGMPPDPVVCAGNGQVLHMVNVALRVTDANNANLKTTSLNAFFGNPANTGVGTTQKFWADPRCAYDPVSLRWVLLAIRVEKNSAKVITSSKLFVGVTKTASMLGDYHWYTYELKGLCNNGACLYDFPTLGLDAHGIWVGANLYGSDTFAGSNLMVISKSAAYAGSSATRCTWNNVMYAGWQVGTIQPAKITPGSSYTASIQYLLASWGTNDLWKGTVKGTINLASATCAGVILESTLITGLQNMSPPPSTVPQTLGGTRLNAGDSRMTQVTLAGGRLFCARQVATGTGATSGVVYFVFNAGTNAVTQQGLLGWTGWSIIAPAMTAKANGRWLLVSTVVPPSSVTGGKGMASMWTWGDAVTNPRPNTVSQYTATTTRLCSTFMGTLPLRTGDYSGADIGSDGRAYAISNSVTNVASCSTTGALTNWGTTIFKVNVDL